MAEFSVEYINPFLMAATSVIKDICQVDMKIGRPYVKTTEFASDSVIIMIGVTGEVRGFNVISGSACTPCSLQDDDGDAGYGTRRYVCQCD